MAAEMEYECDCGQTYTDPKALSLCAQNNHGDLKQTYGLKKLFMVIGNRLVQEHGFAPATPHSPGRDVSLYEPHTTDPLVIIAEFFNNHEEARQLLFELTGEDWPMPEIKEVHEDGNVPPRTTPSKPQPGILGVEDMTEQEFKERNDAPWET